MKPHKILRFITRLNVGGPSRHVAMLLANLNAENFAQVLIEGQVGPGETEWRDSRIDTADKRRVKSLLRPISLIQDWRAWREINALISSEKPCVVHTHQAKAGLIARWAAHRAGVPIIIHTYHGHTFEGYWGPFFQRLNLAIERSLAKKSQVLIAQSKSQAQDILDYLGAAFADKVVVIPPALDDRTYQACDASTLTRARQALELDDAIVLSFVGRLAAVKDPATFLRVLARVITDTPKKVVALIVGGGTQADEEGLQTLAASLGLRPHLRWLGYREDMADIYALTDLVVQTSINEGTPLSLLEARSMACEVVCFDVGGIADLFGADAHVDLIDSGDEESMTQAITARIAAGFSRDPVAAKSYRDKYAAKELARKMEELYLREIEARGVCD